MKGFDLYEQWRSCVFQVSNFVAPSWEALEIWERLAWEKFYDHVSMNGELYYAHPREDADDDPAYPNRHLR